MNVVPRPLPKVDSKNDQEHARTLFPKKEDLL